MAEMEGLAKMMMEMKEMMEKSNARLEALESSAVNKNGQGGGTRDPQVVVEIPGDQPLPKLAEIVSPPREKQLSKTFGTDCSANALLEFLDHYCLCRDMNQQRRIPGWGDRAYRAKELRL